jgi:hypothetical protein
MTKKYPYIGKFVYSDVLGTMNFQLYEETEIEYPANTVFVPHEIGHNHNLYYLDYNSEPIYGIVWLEENPIFSNNGKRPTCRILNKNREVLEKMLIDEGIKISKEPYRSTAKSLGLSDENIARILSIKI